MLKKIDLAWPCHGIRAESEMDQEFYRRSASNLRQGKDIPRHTADDACRASPALPGSKVQ
jgi:hypothetical protein